MKLVHANIGAAICLMMSCVPIGGCAYFKPVTEIVFSPATGEFRITDSKDNALLLQNFKVNKGPDGKFTLSLQKGEFTNNASRVAEANAQQMLAFTEQQRAANEGIVATLSGLSNLAARLTPLADLLGTTSTTGVAP